LYVTNISNCCLGPDEVKNIILTPGYTPPGKGKYSVEVSYPSALNKEKEKTDLSFEVVSPSILQAEVETKFSTFRDIESPRKILNTPSTLDLPFNFIFDGNGYDKILVNEDGWIEFGYGEKGDPFGLSSNTEKSSNFNITSFAEPKKLIAVWWEDLFAGSVFGVTSEITYITENLAPNRVFVIQWLRMQSGTTLLNFQVKLYEKDNHIELCYGERIQGVYNGQGAVVGIKNHIGGDYHYFDITSKSHKAAGELPSFRSPITQWPGPDSVFVIRTRTSLDDAWNIPSGIKLNQPFPNPFNSLLKISYKLPENTLTKVKIIIYDILGRKVKTLIDEKQTDGNKQITWDGFNSSGNVVASGVYVVELKTGKDRLFKKAVLIR